MSGFALSAALAASLMVYIAWGLHRARPAPPTADPDHPARFRVRDREKPMVLALVECEVCGALVPCPAQLHNGWVGEEVRIAPLSPPDGWLLAAGEDGYALTTGLCPDHARSVGGKPVMSRSPRHSGAPATSA